MESVLDCVVTMLFLFVVVAGRVDAKTDQNIINENNKVYQKDSPWHPFGCPFGAFGRPWGALARGCEEGFGGAKIEEALSDALGCLAAPFGQVLAPFCTPLRLRL